MKKTRGAGSNKSSRFVATVSTREPDGWGADGRGLGDDIVQEAESPIATQVLADTTKRLITSNKSPDIPFSQSINPYKGCEHGCIYCFARPTHAYLDLSPGLDFETKIFYKSEARQRLVEELGSRNYRCSTLAIGTNTDPYQPTEKSHRVMRDVLEVLLETKHPVSIVTKSALILRDIDVLGELARAHLVHVNVSVTTLSNVLKSKLEPRTAGPSARLRTIAALNEKGIPTGAMIAPVIPFINDHEIEQIVTAVAAAGAKQVRYILIRLPREVKPLFEEWLANHYPLKAKRVMDAIIDTRGGKAYQSAWHQRMVGTGPIAQLIKSRFDCAIKLAGLNNGELPDLPTDFFVPPNPSSQLSLF